MSGARSNGKPSPPRDQATSPFTSILERLAASTPGALAAMLVDFEGETVDYAGHMDVFDLKVAAAHWRIVMSEITETPQLGSIRRITVRARSRAYLVQQLEDSYAVVLILHRWAAFSVSDRALSEAVTRLSAEAGWPAPIDAGRWCGVDVETAHRDRTRPVRLRVAEGWQPVEVMGALVGLAPREKGFRVRLPSGAEMMLVRERLGRWFADEHVG